MRVPGCKIMPAEGGVHCPGTFDPHSALREGCSNLGRTGGKEVGRYCWRWSPSLICFHLVSEDRVRTGSDVGTLTNELVFRGSEVFNSSKIGKIAKVPSPWPATSLRTALSHPTFFVCRHLFSLLFLWLKFHF